jgi:hypothetical protein
MGKKHNERQTDRQDKTRQTRQNKTDKIRQDKTRQDKTSDRYAGRQMSGSRNPLTLASRSKPAWRETISWYCVGLAAECGRCVCTHAHTHTHTHTYTHTHKEASYLKGAPSCVKEKAVRIQLCTNRKKVRRTIAKQIGKCVERESAVTGEPR